MRRFPTSVRIRTLIVLVAVFGIAMACTSEYQKLRARRDKLRKLAEYRLEAVTRNYDSAWREYVGGETRAQHVYLCSRFVMEAQVDVDGSSAGRLKAAQDHLKRMTKLGNTLGMDSVDFRKVVAYVQEAQYWVAKEQ